MKQSVTLPLLFMLLCCLSMAAQQAPPQPLTFWYQYTVNPGKEDEFMTLVKTVGQPVRDKLMADGVVLAWGIEVPLLRGPNVGTHWVWFTVNDWAGVEKVTTAMQAQLAKLAAEEAKPSAKKGGITTAERGRQAFDGSKTRDWLTRDLVSGSASTLPPAGAMPYTRYFWNKVKPGKAADYRKAWEKYNKPVLDKLVADGAILAYGLAVEELKTDDSFTHFTWVSTMDLGGMDKVRAAFMADRDRRSQEERDAIGEMFTSLTDPDAARSSVTRAAILHLPGQK